MFLPIIYSIFLPLKLGTTWFYVGLPIALVGLVMYTIVWINLVSIQPGDGPATGGLYRFSRHPMYLTGFLMAIGISIACASWLFLVLSIASLFFANVRYASFEERFLLEKYGDAYREYMDRTPRWIGIPKSGGR
jgi:protein-S-isoprenylcysteine O-methyltransferase Ste14